MAYLLVICIEQKLFDDFISLGSLVSIEINARKYNSKFSQTHASFKRTSSICNLT